MRSEQIVSPLWSIFNPAKQPEAMHRIIKVAQRSCLRVVCLSWFRKRNNLSLTPFIRNVAPAIKLNVEAWNLVKDRHDRKGLSPLTGLICHTRTER